MSTGKVEVRRGNVYLTIAADEVDRYIAKGFDVLDANGNVVKRSVPNDVRVLQAEYAKQLKEIEALKAENETLKAENETLKAENETLKAQLAEKDPVPAAADESTDESTLEDPADENSVDEVKTEAPADEPAAKEKPAKKKAAKK